MCQSSEAIAFARQIADALDTAHERGIVHRDLKPANIKIAPDGNVKVLDFGLAKAIEGSGESGGSGRSGENDRLNSPTITTPAMTAAGIILGTAAYMSPEQARGKPVDKRADIWAFGVVLYEMLTGRSPFAGETTTDVIASVVKNEPDWSGLPATTPAHVRTLLQRCLQKDPRPRLRDIADARWELDRVEIATAPSVVTRTNRVAVLLAVGLGVVSLALAAAVYRAQRTTPAARAEPVSLAVTFPRGSFMQLGQPLPTLALSPDGRLLVYTAVGPEGSQLWLRALERFEATPLAGTAGARTAFFSPDGKSIAFFADGKLKRMPVAGGPPTTLCAAPGPFGGVWTIRDEIVLSLATSGDAGLYRVAATGGTLQKIASGPLWWPDALPGGQAVVVTAPNTAASASGDLRLAAVDLASGKVTPLLTGGTYARYSPTGHLLYLRNGAIMATPIAADTLQADDTRVTVVNGAFQDPTFSSGNYAISPSGHLAYAPGDGSEFDRALTVVGMNDRQPLLDLRRYFFNPRVSPDGRRVAVTIRAWHDNVWIIERERGTMTRVGSTDWSTAQSPVWMRDGSRVAFVVLESEQSQAPNLFWAPSDGSGAAERLATSPYTQAANGFSPDGKTLVFSQNHPDTGWDLFTVSLPDRKVQPLLQTRFAEQAASFSADGKWIAFQSSRSGTMQVYLAPFPAMQPLTQVSTRSGTNARWNDSNRLFYRDGTLIQSVSVTTTPTLALSQPQAVANGIEGPGGYYDVLPDGRIVAVDREELAGARSELRVILNWTSLLEQSNNRQ